MNRNSLERVWGASRHGASFPFGNRLARVGWGVAWIFLCRWTPRPLHGWRAFCLRVFGAKIGKGVHVYPSVSIWAPWNLRCDDGVGIADRVILYNQAPIAVGARTVISQGAHLCTGTHDFEDPGFPLITRPIEVGEDAWLAAECFIHPGLAIGQGAVIGARAVLTQDALPWTIYAGNPATAISVRKRGENPMTLSATGREQQPAG